MNNVNVNMANIGPMGGAVGAPMPMMGAGAGVPPQGVSRQHQANETNRALLNTYIYEYFVRYEMWDCARAILNSDSQVKVQKDSPGGRRDENGNLVGNGVGDDPMDTDSKDDLDHKRPDDLPAPQVPSPIPDSSFLYDWFCIFFEMLSAQKGKAHNNSINQYVTHNQTQQRHRHEQMLRSVRPDMAQQNFHMMRGLPNGGMNMNMPMKPGGNQLPRTAMANSQHNPQMHLLQQKASQMQRDPSDMDGNRARPGSPGSADNAPSPSKRPRLEGGPYNPNQAVMMPNGRPGAQGMPGQQVGTGPNSALQQLQQHGIPIQQLSSTQIQNFTNAPPNVQAKIIATYAANLPQHPGVQMPNKPMPGAAVPQPQGSPMIPQGPDGAAGLPAFYNAPDMAGPNGMRPGPAGAQAAAGSNSNHALQDYQMQLMLLEQQNKKRLMMARQEQDMTGAPMPRADGSAGPPGPGGPNGPPFPGASPQGARTGTSPNPAEQMKRANPQLTNPANMGSPVPDGPQSRGSPNPMNFMGNQLDPSKVPQFFPNGMNGMDGAMVAAAQMNGGMRPPPGQPFNGQINPQMMQAARQQQQQQQPGQGGPQMQWQGGPNGNQMPPQGAQPQIQGTPQQRTAAMPPPSAPGASNNANSRNATSSPQTSNAAPPTPSQATKPAPKKQEKKSAKSKKKANANLNAAAATPAAEPAPEAEQPAPATPITPVGQGNFKAGQNAGAATMVPNGQPAVPPQPPATAVPVTVQPTTDTTGFGSISDGGLDFSNMGSMEFANPLTTSDVLNDFDFDSFLRDNDGGDGGGFDFNPGFPEIGTD